MTKHTIEISCRARTYLRELKKGSKRGKVKYSVIIDEIVARDKKNKKQQVHRRNLK